MVKCFSKTGFFPFWFSCFNFHIMFRVAVHSASAIARWNCIWNCIKSGSIQCQMRVEPRQESKSQTGLQSYRNELESWNFGISKYRYYTIQAANNKGAYQTAQMCRLIWGFIVRQRRLSDCVDAQADLRLCCSHMAFNRFSQAQLNLVRHLSYKNQDHKSLQVITMNTKKRQFPICYTLVICKPLTTWSQRQ